MKKAGIWLAVLAAVAGLLAPIAASAATTQEQRQQQINAELRRLHGDVDELSAQQVRLLAELKVSQRTRADLDTRVAALDAAITTAETDLNSVNADLDAAVAVEQSANAALTDARHELHAATNVLRKQAIDAFMHWGQSKALDQMLRDVKDINDGPRITAFVARVAERQGEVVAEQKRLRHATSQLEDEAAAARDSVAAKQQDVLTRKSALESARAQQDAARAAVAAEAANEQRLLTALQAKKSEYLQQINELQRESNDIASQLRKRQSGEAVTPSGHGVLAYPVTDPVITSPFGYRIHPIYGDRRLHTGIDLRAAPGTPAYAAGGGVVVFAGWKSGYGNTIVIDHGGSLATLYAHNTALLVSQGATVKRGQRISSSGCTGNCTGPHVHFEVRVNGTPVDPMKYL